MDGAALAVSIGEDLRALIVGSSSGAKAQERLTFWAAATGGEAVDDPALERRLASDIMQLFGKVDAGRVRARRGAMLVRAASSLRAIAEPAPRGLRRDVAAGDFERIALSQPFAGFFAMESFDLRFRRFDGSLSPAVNREVLIGADAVTVLPYDPVRDRVLLVEQVRTGPMARGDANPWQLEAVAGRIDPFETPEDAARREALEEAGVTLGRLEKVAEYYPTTAAFSEYIYSYVALCDLPDGTAGVFGLAEEAEDIRGHLVEVSDLLARLDRGEFGNAPLILTVQWLVQHRDRLRREASGKI